MDDITRIVSEASRRVNYRLAFTCTPEPRMCHASGMYGPELPNAYNPDESFGSGDWEDPEFAAVVETERDAIDRWFMTAIREAAHEAMEWYRVDGKIFLDPHGNAENAIHAASEKFARDLLAIRAEVAS